MTTKETSASKVTIASSVNRKYKIGYINGFVNLLNTLMERSNDVTLDTIIEDAYNHLNRSLSTLESSIDPSVATKRVEPDCCETERYVAERTKKCGDCKRHLPLYMFSRNRTEKDGLQGTCRTCQAKRNKVYRDKMRSALTTLERESSIETKVCVRCKRRLPKHAFGLNVSKKDGLQSYCKECVIAYRISHDHRKAQAKP